MPRDNRSNRFQLMMTDSEADAIEQWAAEIGISSKAEAIRQLVNIGLNASAQTDRIQEQGHRLLNLRRRAVREISGYRARIDAIPEPDRLAIHERAFRVLSELFADLSLAASDLSTSATRAIGQAIAARRVADIEETLTALEDGGTDLDEIRARLAGIKALSEREPRR